MALSDIRSQWGDVFNQVGQKYGIDPDLLLAIAAQENVNPAYNNPLGRSSDAGVHRYGSFDEGAAAIDKQAALLTDPNGPYRDFVNTGSVYDLAKVYSPVGAKNDVYGTNADEPSGIIAALAKIKGTDAATLGGQHAASSTAVSGMPVQPTSPVPATSYLGNPYIDTSSTGNAQSDRTNQLLAAMRLSGGGAGGRNTVADAITQGLQMRKAIQALQMANAFGMAPRAQLISLPTSTA